VATAFSRSALYFYVCRFLTGAGIGGEYAAINWAIDELIPARLRGRVDLIINGSFWLGTMFGAALALFLLDTDRFPADLGWRLAFGLGAVLGLAILLVRRKVPESPRWQFIHGHNEKAEELVAGIEQEVEKETGQQLEEVTDSIRIRQRKSIGFGTIANTAFKLYPKRTILGLSLFIGQAFLYNAVFFTQALVLSTFFGVADDVVPIYIIPFAFGNLLGPLLQGDQRLLRLPDRGRADDRGRDRRVVHRGRGGRQVARGRCPAADRRGGRGRRSFHLARIAEA
jgi:MFS family permease